jgi:hypothetical protein
VGGTHIQVPAVVAAVLMARVRFWGERHSELWAWSFRCSSRCVLTAEESVDDIVICCCCCRWLAAWLLQTDRDGDKAD